MKHYSNFVDNCTNLLPRYVTGCLRIHPVAELITQARTSLASVALNKGGIDHPRFLFVYPVILAEMHGNFKWVKKDHAQM